MSLKRIEQTFAQKARPLFMPYMMGGYPSLEESLAIGRSHISGGADMLELGVPFSDPLADGPTIQQAATTALNRNVTLADVLQVGKELAASVPVVLMCYVNTIFARGIDQFVCDLEAANISGVIVPDLPVEEASELQRKLSEADLAFILLVAPSTSEERLQTILTSAQGFVYLISVLGTTGERAGRQFSELEGLLEQIRRVKKLPIAVGFGISTPSDVQEVCAAGADGVIVGSHFVRCIAESDDPQDRIYQRTCELVAAIK